ncbi:hypothetical protein A3D88_01455 [Candidatus Peribacteria bacterium RIFCSPHIGHO2_02_FULL_52_16]|nr:MAG: hypothetical protein A2706_03695 [Candidatus Peribacteria bacterium RIFCSPHIGHO2_01_FULL_51_35]OGJ60986.1 MAG: hypothetical protein A3D88_01455 [Candidatus Peribacteria bacterium RIFCSPHIGHO2_02_FULL_52_16]
MDRIEKTDTTDLYLSLIKKCLTDTLHIEKGFDDKRRVYRNNSYSLKQFIMNGILRVLESRRMHVYYIRNENLSKERMLAKRNTGKDWPKFAETMIGLSRLDNIQHCAETVLHENIPGDFIETGVWRGGATIFMRAILMAYGIKNRTVWVADSFEGLPSPDSQYPADTGDIHHLYKEVLAISLEQVQENFRRYDLLDGQVHFLKGWFKDTLSNAPIEHLAILRLDGDMYSSTMEALQALYDKLSPGGFLIIDDYGLEGCKKAIHDFRKERNINEEIIIVDQTGAFWRKKTLP